MANAQPPLNSSAGPFLVCHSFQYLGLPYLPSQNKERTYLREKTLVDDQLLLFLFGRVAKKDSALLILPPSQETWPFSYTHLLDCELCCCCCCLYVICLTRMNKQGGDGQTRAQTIFIVRQGRQRPYIIHTRDSLLFCLLFSLFCREGKKKN